MTLYRTYHNIGIYHNIIQQKKLKTPKTKWSTNTSAKLCTMKYYRFSRRRKNLPIWSFSLLQIKEKSTKKQNKGIELCRNISIYSVIYTI